MKSIGGREIAEFVGIAAIVASLVFVGFQIRQDQKIAIADTYGALNEATANLSDLIDRNAELWKKGLDGEDLSDIEYIKFLSLVKAVQIHSSSFHVRWSWVGPAPPEIASRRYAYALYIFPGLRNARSEEFMTLRSLSGGTFRAVGLRTRLIVF